MQRIAVEDSLNHVKEYLQQNGYEVVNLDGGQSVDCDCCVMTGQDQNMMGMQDIVTNVSVINAEGLTEEQILAEVQRRMKPNE